ncbi:MAG: hypothetical protein IJN62_01050 [Clostridia bacterium]|nr:hypothetical protein [Clostridia bacterium]
MNYKKVIAFSNTCVLFKLDNGYFALVAVDDEEAKHLVTISKYAESHMKLAVFESGKNIPEKTLLKAASTLSLGEHVFICKELPEELKHFLQEGN